MILPIVLLLGFAGCAGGLMNRRTDEVTALTDKIFKTEDDAKAELLRTARDFYCTPRGKGTLPISYDVKPIVQKFTEARKCKTVELTGTDCNKPPVENPRIYMTGIEKCIVQFECEEIDKSVVQGYSGTMLFRCIDQ